MKVVTLLCLKTFSSGSMILILGYAYIREYAKTSYINQNETPQEPL
jgi:hypothetical protein